MIKRNSIKDIKDRLAYVRELLSDPYPTASPSSDEYVNPEFWQFRTNDLRQEMLELQTKLAKKSKAMRNSAAPRPPAGRRIRGNKDQHAD